MKNTTKRWIVYVSTFPPRECGIATFTNDLMAAFDEMYKPREGSRVIAMNRDETTHYVYDTRVVMQIPEPVEKAYVDAAHALNSMPEVSLVHIQHEYGIYSGAFGEYIVSFLRELAKPAVVTLHTVLPAPDPKMKEVTQAITNHVQKVIVMTHASKRLLIDVYGIEHEKISVIPHGIHPSPLSDGERARAELGLAGRKVISTFGLLSPDKGIEYGIEAMKEIAKKRPDAVYLVIGATHPNIVRQFGESYRASLVAKVRELGLEDNVFFYDKYVTLKELLAFLDATHVYLAPPQNPNQAVSGTLSYALGQGRPVVSTAFAQAKEDVTPEVGALIGFKTSDGIADAILPIISDDALRARMAQEAFIKTRDRTWPNVMLKHMAEYIALVPELGREEENLPRIKLDHVYEMTDSFGMFQFAKLLEPDVKFGYTTDDNARALIAVVRQYESSKKPRLLGLIQTYLTFIDYMQILTGGFHNYVDADRRIPLGQHVREDLETTSARALHALAVTAASKAVPVRFRKRAEWLFKRHVQIAEQFEHTRSIALQTSALCAWQSVHPSDETMSEIRSHADALVARYDATSAADWRWFEDGLSYSNATTPLALIDAYGATRNERYLTVARESMDFLIANSFEGEMCTPIGQNGWMKRGEKKATHDQQPEEVSTLVSALKALYDATHDEKYAVRMRQAFSWFLGHNSLRQVVYDEQSGGCYDGVGVRDVNLNEGAESTVAYLLARLEFEKEAERKHAENGRDQIGRAAADVLA